MKNKWDYSGINTVCFSDKKQESYKKAAEFLGDTVEDWGCGTGWAKKYFKNYRGIDGSPSKQVKPEDVVDLREYTSTVDNILMRQVLGLNKDWEKILENVKSSFSEKFCLVLYAPLAEETHIGDYFKTKKGEKLPVVFFNKQDILDFFPESEFEIKEESIKTNQGYGQEWILYVKRL